MATIASLPRLGNAAPRLPFFTLEAPRSPQAVDAGPRYAALLQDTEHTVEHLLRYYASEVAPQKAPCTQRQIAALSQHLDADLRALQVDELTPAVLRAWRDRLRQTMKPGSARHYLEMFSAILTVAVEDLEWITVHPMRKVRKPPASPGRVRFLSPGEQEVLLQECQRSRHPALYPLVLLAMTTGCRRGEILGLRWADVDLQRGFLRLAKTKNGERRAVPVPSIALEELRTWGQGQPAGAWVIPRRGDRTAFPGEHAWRHALGRAGIKDFRFHDLRHSFASWLCMSGASLVEIAELLGHKTLNMVKRYAHLSQAHTAGVVERMAQEFIRRPQPHKGAPHGEL